MERKGVVLTFSIFRFKNNERFVTKEIPETEVGGESLIFKKNFLFCCSCCWQLCDERTLKTNRKYFKEKLKIHWKNQIFWFDHVIIYKRRWNIFGSEAFVDLTWMEFFCFYFVFSTLYFRLLFIYFILLYKNLKIFFCFGGGAGAESGSGEWKKK